MFQKTLEALLKEERIFPPPPAFQKQASMNDPKIYEQASKDRDSRWDTLLGMLKAPLA